MLAGLLRKGQPNKNGYDQDAYMNGSNNNPTQIINNRLNGVLDPHGISALHLNSNGNGIGNGNSYSINGSTVNSNPNSNPLDNISDSMLLKLFGTTSFETKYRNSGVLPNSFKNIEHTRNSIHGLSNTNKFVSDSFRLIVAEETGQMASINNHRFIIDTTFPKNSSMSHIRNSELKEYIFGSPLRLSESTKSDKFRTIPNSNMTLIIRSFTYSSKLSNKLAICLCVPTNYFPVITEGWSAISQWLDYTQKIILVMTKKGIHQKHSPCPVTIKNGAINNPETRATTGYTFYNNMSQELLVNKSVNSPFKNNDASSSSLLSIDARFKNTPDVDKIIQKLQKVVMPCLQSLYSIPRLFIFPENSIAYIDCWLQEIFSWLEIKDGPNSSFLPSLLAKIIIDYKESMSGDTSDRIVVMTGSTVVADKLTFIIAGLLEPKNLKLNLKSSHSNISIYQPSSNSTFPDATTLNEKTELLSLNVNSSGQIPSFENINNTKDKHEACKSHSSSSNDLMKISPNSPAASDKIHSSRRGWEIPKKNVTQNVTTLSPGESFAHVIQPSSINSGGSLNQLHASLSSSQSGSYGSWFKQMPSLSHFMQHSNSLKSNDSWDRPASSNMGLQRTTSNTSVQQARLNFGITPQPSPSISTYDEYPWFDTPSSSQIDTNVLSTTHATAQPIVGANGFLYANSPAKSYTSNLSIPSTLTATEAIGQFGSSLTNSHKQMDRNTGASVSWPIKDISDVSDIKKENINLERSRRHVVQDGRLDDAFDKICNFDRVEDLKYTLTPSNAQHAGTLELDMAELATEESMVENQHHYTELLPRYTSYLSMYNSWFKLQAIQLNSDSKFRIVDSMKKDLENKDGVSIEKTLMIVLGSREIHEVSVRKENNKLMQKNKNVFSNGKITKSSATSNHKYKDDGTFDIAEDDTLKQSTDEYRNELSNCLLFIEYTIKSAKELYSDTEISDEKRDKEIMKLYLGLFHYK
ncbi:hypothetical protein TPHA_0E03360 [Tetrapisispora phaffii CBS 4417]|uniref:Protein LST4 n=1 Tax=Tetrapisispora phaffii (strain ATCC 24235 / CBS 4417 / NBRC 1672 / NRRL Y-8282 / UCD 70-5) TaxID=1071381 RepID=G8BU48_TETPH|nr:hypothetical protein TPHA_0E03360 [Tetrapisispora phaffii CBS 4417]CCE63426.1 hypothetical protein TPHA_0E03360 [Tetrapisispora phaffii CBS 4417]